MSGKEDAFNWAVQDWKANDEWEFADKEAAWHFMFQQGVASAGSEASRLISDLIREFDRRGLEGVPLLLKLHNDLMN